MVETYQGFVGATRDGEGAIWEETKRDGWDRLEGTWGESSGYYLVLSRRWRDVSCHGRRIFGDSLVKTGKSVYVKVVEEQALSKAAVVRLEDSRGLRSEPTHSCIQSDNRQFEEGWYEVRRWIQGVDVVEFTSNFFYIWEFVYNFDMEKRDLGVGGRYRSPVGFSSKEKKILMKILKEKG
jgi:hypothetical protein